MRPNLAARAGRWSAAHWKTATFGWLLLVVAAVVLGSAVGTKRLADVEQANGETARAERMLVDAGIRPTASESVLVESTGETAASPAFRRAVHDVRTTLAARPEVTKLQATVSSKNGHAALVQFDLKGNANTASDRVKPVLDAVASVQRSHPSLRIEEFGSASADLALNDTIGKDFAHAERLSVPLTFLILLFAFGAFVAAGVPVLLALSAVLGSVGLSALISHVAHASDTTSSVILLMGMAVGVDYSLFYVKREREERAAGREGRDALHRAAATSGQAVLVSGIPCSSQWPGCCSPARRSSLARDRRNDRRVHVDDRVADGAARTARPLGDRIDRGCSPSSRRDHAGAAPDLACSCLADAPANHPPTAQGRPAGVTGLGLPSYGRRFAIRSSQRRGFATMLDRARAAGVRHALEADRLRRSPGASPDRADLRKRPARVPRLAEPGDGRRSLAPTSRSPAASGARGPAATSARVRGR